MFRDGLIATLAISSLVLMPAAAAQDAARGRDLASACVPCHGENGIGTQDDYPNLAGQKALYLAQTLAAYRDGTRESAVMYPLAKDLSDADIDDLAAWYASLSGAPRPGAGE